MKFICILISFFLVSCASVDKTQPEIVPYKDYSNQNNINDFVNLAFSAKITLFVEKKGFTGKLIWNTKSGKSSITILNPFNSVISKVYLNKSDVDLAILMKILLYKSKNTQKLKLFAFLEKYINIHELIGINDLKIQNLLFGLETLFNGKNRFNTYKDILIEELEDFIKYKDSLCSYKMIDILLINLVPFINYPFNLSCDFIIKSELEFLINSLIKTNKNNYKNILVNKIYKDYIENKLFTEDYIGVQIYKILKFKK